MHHARAFFSQKRTLNSAHHQTTHLLLICDWNALVTHHVALFLYTTSRATVSRSIRAIVLPLSFHDFTYRYYHIYNIIVRSFVFQILYKETSYTQTQSTVLNPIYTQAKNPQSSKEAFIKKREHCVLSNALLTQFSSIN